MTREIYCFMDTVSEACGEPFTMANLDELRRWFKSIMDDPSIPDYAKRDTIVFHLGTFYPDPVNPHIEPCIIPIVCLRGDTFNE